MQYNLDGEWSDMMPEDCWLTSDNENAFGRDDFEEDNFVHAEWMPGPDLRSAPRRLLLMSQAL
jgi:hypothetical protein